MFVCQTNCPPSPPSPRLSLFYVFALFTELSSGRSTLVSDTVPHKLKTDCFLRSPVSPWSRGKKNPISSDEMSEAKWKVSADLSAGGQNTDAVLCQLMIPPWTLSISLIECNKRDWNTGLEIKSEDLQKEKTFKAPYLSVWISTWQNTSFVTNLKMKMNARLNLSKVWCLEWFSNYASAWWYLLREAVADRGCLGMEDLMKGGVSQLQLRMRSKHHSGDDKCWMFQAEEQATMA